MMTVTIKDRKLFFRNVTPGVEAMLEKWFSARDPQYQFQVGIIQGTSYDGWVRKYNKIKQTLPITFLGELKRNCQKFNVQFQIEDRREPPKFQADLNVVSADMFPGIRLEDYQVRAIRAACSEECGLIQASPGAGKTEVIAGIIKAYACPTVVLAEQTVVVDQLKARLELRQVVEEVGQFYAGKTPNDKMVCVGTSASLFIPPQPERRGGLEPEEFIRQLQSWTTRKRNAELYRSFVYAADLAIVDEADLGITMTHRHMLRHWFKGRRRFGTSGTPFDPSKPVQGLIVRELYGSIISSVDRQEVEECGRIIPVTYHMIVFGEDGDKWEGSTWDIALREKVIENQCFHQLVTKIVAAFPNDGTLVLVEINDLGQALQEAIPGSVFVHGLTSKGNRRKLFKKFEEREITCLIGGKIIKRGFDLKNGCENLILCGMGQMQSDLLQQIGRAMRLNSKGKARVFDFYCMNNKYLYDHSKERLKTMVAAGYKTFVHHKGETMSGKDLVKRKFRL
ncbi:MAG: helicase-related protein [Candidatus Nanopelagicaceae bacterium]|nr:helicase-related protein [Candidatus Nanopelagicaceae bacterium]